MSDLNNLKERFKSLSDKKENLLNEKIQLETKLGVAREQYAEYAKTLKEKFGADSIDDAKVILERMTSELEKKLADAENRLSGANV